MVMRAKKVVDNYFVGTIKIGFEYFAQTLFSFQSLDIKAFYWLVHLENVHKYFSKFLALLFLLLYKLFPFVILEILCKPW